MIELRAACAQRHKVLIAARVPIRTVECAGGCASTVFFPRREESMANPTDTPEHLGSDVRYELSFPEADTQADQDSEFCEVRVNGSRRRIRFHDYHEIYTLPGLYEQLFYDELKCVSPTVLTELLTETMAETGTDPG